MPTVRFSGVFKWSPDGMSTKISKKGDVEEVSEAIAASIVKTRSGVVIDLGAEATEKAEADAAAAEKAEAEKVDVTLQPGDAEAAEAGKAGPDEDKSVGPAEDKADSKE